MKKLATGAIYNNGSTEPINNAKPDILKHEMADSEYNITMLNVL
jgi:hypothetical protein